VAKPRQVQALADGERRLHQARLASSNARNGATSSGCDRTFVDREHAAASQGREADAAHHPAILGPLRVEKSKSTLPSAERALQY
jgi:hypothetical protein